MSQALPFDELNIMSSDKRRSEPYVKYFSKMEISDDEKQTRIAFSNDMEEVILYSLSLAEVMIENDEIDEEYLEKQLYEKYTNVASMYLTVDSYTKQYISEVSKQIVRTTFLYGKSEDLQNSNPDQDEKNLSSDGSGIAEPSRYYLSNDRAMFISECEANSILNYKEYSDALKSGKRTKTWVDIGDNRERKTHLEVGGTTIPIKELFVVGNSLMLFPKDTSQSPSASEIVNCRCSIRYN